MLNCFVAMVGQFPSSGEFLRQSLQGNAGGMVFQLFFFFLVIVILLNMLFGIIVYVHPSPLASFCLAWLSLVGGGRWTAPG